MFGLIMLAILLGVGAISLVAGTDTRDGFADTRWTADPTGLR